MPEPMMNVSPTAPVKRYWRNFLLQPNLQVKIGLYTVLLAIIFFGAMMSVLYVRFVRLYDMVLELTDMRDEVIGLMDKQLLGVSWWLAGGICSYVLLNIIMSIYFTHKMIGPTIAFRRHIRSLGRGDYASRVYLRNGDAFVEVAQDLNKLAEVLAMRSHETSPIAKSS